MKATATREKQTDPAGFTRESLINFDEGLIGFSDCKRFVLMESDAIAPFRQLQSVERPDVSFLVIDPSLVMKGYYNLISDREWETVGLEDAEAKLAMVICIIGPSPTESTGNFQAPLIINYKTMSGRQVILTDAGLTSRSPLL